MVLILFYSEKCQYIFAKKKFFTGKMTKPDSEACQSQSKQ